MKISSFIRMQPFDEAEAIAKQSKFYITEFKSLKLANGFIQIVVDWGDADFRFKSGVLGIKTFAYNYCSLEVRFPLADFNYSGEGGDIRETEMAIEVGISNESDGEKINYTPLFFQNAKYGVVVYFAPNGWNDENDSIVLSNDSSFNRKPERISNE